MNGFSIADIESFSALMYDASPDDLYLVPYSYPINFQSVIDDGTKSGILQLSANADFIALGIRHVTMASNDTVPTITSKPAGEILCLITDTSTGDQFTNGAAVLENIGTNGVGEVLFDFPRLLPGRGALSVQVTNRIGRAAEVIQIELHGVLVRAWSDRPTPPQIRGV